MGFAYARAQRDAYLLLRMEAAALGQRPGRDEPAAKDQSEDVPEPEHRHGDGCACHLRGE
ncbi:hypothetical protein [Nevskia soli]|uniref:hypothetical protein n=1 Tax=Nevskia soli TaxID=418856 RepID=UPI0004A6E74A|nr:hypothetical protein [Nevskia soli]